MTDSQLVFDLVRRRSSEAFSAIVGRYVNLVYGTARRIVGDSHQAEDVTQAAFVVLMKKAGSIDPSTLPGWLVNTTRLAAKEAMRSKLRRLKHEKRAAWMKEGIQQSRDEPTVEELTPIMDEALSRLNAADRSAVVMRFLQGLSFAEVGIATGATEEAARKRVERALDKLRGIFMKEGFFPSVGGLMVVLASQQALHAPAMLAGSLPAACAAGGSGASLILAKGAASAMTSAKIKLAAMVMLAVLLTGGLGVGVETIRRAMAEPPAAITAPAAQNQSVDLLGRYPTRLTEMDANPDRARQWTFRATDIFQVSHFSLGVGKDLEVEIGPADLGIGHCADGAVWAVLIPRAGGTLTSRMHGQEAISNLWLRFHPKEIDHLFPPETVSAGGSIGLLQQMRNIARVKIISSWQADSRAMIPGPTDMIVDVDVKNGVRRFFAVDTETLTAQYFPVFEPRFVKAPPTAKASEGEASTAEATDPLLAETGFMSTETGFAVLLGGVLCLLIATGTVVILRYRARSRSI